MNTVIDTNEKAAKRAAMRLIWLCWLAYTCSYIGKVNYAANINQVMNYYSVDHADAGLVSTFLFFSYGVGQFLNGFLCKKYNLKWMIFGSLMVSGSINLAVAVTPNFEIVKYLWLINGLSLSVLWPCIIRLLSESLPKRYMAKATVIVGTTVAAGTFAIYALSALYASFSMFKIAFITAAIAMPIVAFIWMFNVSGAVKNAKCLCKETEEPIKIEQVNTTQNTAKTVKHLLYVSIAVMAVYAVATNFIKDGLTTWIPSILKENYALDDSFSIILSLSLPLVSMLGNFFAVSVHKKIPDFVYQCALAFGVAGVIVAIVIGGLSWGQFVLTLVGFTAVSFLASSNNSVITSIFPLFMKDKLNSGMMASVLNGCCYIGSTAASYGLGLVADNFGWEAVFYLLLYTCVAVCAVAGIYFGITKILKSRKGGTTI